MSDFTARKLSILLVDDDPALVRMLRTVLTLELQDEVDLHTTTEPTHDPITFTPYQHILPPPDPERPV